MSEYQWRKSVLEKTKRIIRFDEREISEVRGESSGVRILWSDLANVRLTYAPTRMKPNRFLLTLKSATGAPVIFENMSYESFGNFVDQSTAFTKFTKDLFAEIARQRKDLPLMVGSPPASYWAQLISIIFIIFFLAFILISLPLPLGSWPIAALMELGIIAVSLPLLIKWAVRARPRGFSFSQIPEDLFPK